MNKSLIPSKKKKSIKGIAKGKVLNQIKGSFCSYVFLTFWFYMHSVLGEVPFPFVLPIICTVIADVIYCICLYKNEIWRQEDQYQKNKKQVPLHGCSFINENGGDSAISFLIALLGASITAIVVSVTKSFLSLQDGFDIVMCFMTIGYFQVFWKGGPRQLRDNWENIRALMKIDRQQSFVKKIKNFMSNFAFACILMGAALYQLWDLIQNFITIISLKI